jgi:hypothetical protein
MTEDQMGDDLFETRYPKRPVPRPDAPTSATRATPLDHGIPTDVRDLFEELALSVKRSGINHYSARAILHRIRWHYQIDRGVQDFKINNNISARLARWLMAKHPVLLKDFFETREKRSHEDD